MRWVCIALPRLALDGMLRGRGDAGQPWALVEDACGRAVLHSLNDSARRLGLTEGMDLDRARAQVPTLQWRRHVAAEEARWHALLGAWAYRFSSQVSLQHPGCVSIEVGASLRLFGPWPRLEARLREELDRLGFVHRIVAAPTAAAARALVSAHDGLAIAHAEPLRRALGQLPVEAVFDAATCEGMRGMGLRRLRQLWALPRSALARRFPQGVLERLDVLLGSRSEPLVCYRPPDRFELRIELEREVSTSEALRFPLRRMTADLAAFLAARDGGVQRFVLRLEHADAKATEVRVGLQSPEREASLLNEVAWARLERTRVPAPVQAMGLHADELPAFVPRHQDLFRSRPQQSLDWQTLCERLRARLGRAAVQPLHWQQDHRPERIPAGEAQEGAAELPATLGPRPVWLLPAPVPLRGPAPTLLAGPERIESGWWDGGDVRRDYYVARLPTGAMAWVFRMPGDGPWLLHGWFA